VRVGNKKANLDKMYKLPDRGNIYLRIDFNGSKYWIFNYTHPLNVRATEPLQGAFFVR